MEWRGIDIGGSLAEKGYSADDIEYFLVMVRKAEGVIRQDSFKRPIRGDSATGKIREDSFVKLPFDATDSLNKLKEILGDVPHALRAYFIQVLDEEMIGLFIKPGLKGRKWYGYAVELRHKFRALVNDAPQSGMGSAHGEPLAKEELSSEQTRMEWVSDDTGLQNLHRLLIEENLIREIDFHTFKLHFSGKPQTPKIDWIGGHQYGVFYLLKELHQYLNSDIYEGDGTVTGKPISLHFSFKGNPKDISQLAKLKEKNKSDFKNPVRRQINSIIKELAKVAG